jgi:hypothetical protein
MSDANREARILELRHLVEQGEYQINSEQIAARLLDEHLTVRPTTGQNALGAAASAPSPTIPPK